MKIFKFKIVRQTILLLLLLLVSAFEVSVAKQLPARKNCDSAKVKSVRLFGGKNQNKFLQVKKMNDSRSPQVELSIVNNSWDQLPVLYMYTLPQSAKPKWADSHGGGQFLLYDPRTERFICRQVTRNKRQKRNLFVTEVFPILNRCSFTEVPARAGYVQYRIRSNYLLNKNDSYVRETVSCSCEELDFAKRMRALKDKRRGRQPRHKHLHRILDGFNINSAIKRCNDWKMRHRD